MSVGPQMRADHGLLRVLRGTVVGTSAVAVALCGHLGGGGAPPSVAILLLLTTAASAAGWRLSGLRWTTSRLVGVLLVAQGLLHVVFDMAAPGVATSNGRMLLAHMAATLVTLALLERSEAALWSMLDLLVLRALRVLDFAVPASGPPRTSFRPGAAVCRSGWLVECAPRRGPPATATS